VIGTIVLVSGLAAIAAGNAAWWWYRDRDRQALVRRLTGQRDLARESRDYWRQRAHVAEDALSSAAEKATALEERNRMLTDLIGGDQT
jgi:hypothetical protein